VVGSPAKVVAPWPFVGSCANTPVGVGGCVLESMPVDNVTMIPTIGVPFPATTVTVVFVAFGTKFVVDVVPPWQFVNASTPASNTKSLLIVLRGCVARPVRSFGLHTCRLDQLNEFRVLWQQWVDCQESCRLVQGLSSEQAVEAASHREIVFGLAFHACYGRRCV